LQILNEHKSSKSESKLEKDKKDSKNEVDSLIKKTINLSDSIQILKGILISIDNKFYETNQKVAFLGKINNSLNKKLIESDRPLLDISMTKINKSSVKGSLSSLDIDFNNFGKRSVADVFGKEYISFRDTIWDTGTISVSRSDIFPNNRGFSLHEKMLFEPILSTYKTPIYYYFKLTYSDIILDTLYKFERIMKVIPDLPNELVLCREWEIEKIRNAINSKLVVPKKL
jgi:hypothetical protein